MKLLLKNGTIVNVFTDTLEKANVLLEDGRIAGVGDCYTDNDADIVEDISGRIVCPGFIDGHVHVESSMLRPAEFARAALPHGTTAIVADPHEIANVSGEKGISYMLEESEGLPLRMYFMAPSCVPATPFDEAGAVLKAEEVQPFFAHPRVLGLGEMMNYPGVLAGDPDVRRKISAAEKDGLIINGHAPWLSGRDLDRYISCGIYDDHECSGLEEALERIRKGQTVMIRQGTAARNLGDLLPLFDEPYNRHCMLVTDDRAPADLLWEGHIDSIIRLAVRAGKSPLAGIRMATLQAARHFGLRRMGAVAPGYAADLLVLRDLETVEVETVYVNGEKAVSRGKTLPFDAPAISGAVWEKVCTSFAMPPVTENDFYIEPQNGLCRVIEWIPGQLITREKRLALDFTKHNGVDTERDILKLAVIERHHHTGHIGRGYITGLGLREGAAASSVAHDSHNLIVLGANDRDMAAAAERVRRMGGGMAVAKDGAILSEMALPIGGLMSTKTAAEAADELKTLYTAALSLGLPRDRELFTALSFMSLPVIPDLKMITTGLFDVNTFQPVSLFTEN